MRFTLLVLFIFMQLIVVILKCSATNVNQTLDFLLLCSYKITRVPVPVSTMARHRSSIVNARQGMSVDYDMKNDCLLWTDKGQSEICRQCFNPNRDMEVLHKVSVGYFGRIAYDWVSQMLYFTNVTHSKVEVISTAPTPDRAQMHRTVVELEQNSDLFGIAVHPRRGYLFWTCRGGKNIMRANLNGSDMRQLIEGDKSHEQQKPQLATIIVDFEMERLFWTDKSNIHSCDFNGGQVNVILAAEMPVAIAVINNTIFWSEWNTRKFRKAIVKEYNSDGIKLLTSSDSPNISTVTENIKYWDTCFISQSIQSEMNACSGWNGCSHACVGVPSDNFKCVCPQEMQHSKSGACVCPKSRVPLGRRSP